MDKHFLKPRQALNKVFLKVRPVRTQVGQLVYEIDVLREEGIKILGGGSND